METTMYQTEKLQMPPKGYRAKASINGYEVEWNFGDQNLLTQQLISWYTVRGIEKEGRIVGVDLKRSWNKRTLATHVAIAMILHFKDNNPNDIGNNNNNPNNKNIGNNIDHEEKTVETGEPYHQKLDPILPEVLLVKSCLKKPGKQNITHNEIECKTCQQLQQKLLESNNECNILKNEIMKLKDLLNTKQEEYTNKSNSEKLKQKDKKTKEKNKNKVPNNSICNKNQNDQQIQKKKTSQMTLSKKFLKNFTQLHVTDSINLPNQSRIKKQSHLHPNTITQRSELQETNNNTSDDETDDDETDDDVNDTSSDDSFHSKCVTCLYKTYDMEQCYVCYGNFCGPECGECCGCCGKTYCATCYENHNC